MNPSIATDGHLSEDRHIGYGGGMTTDTTDQRTDLDPWRGFTQGRWSSRIDVRDFIQLNYTPYEGADEFLAGPTARTESLWRFVADLMVEERKHGILDVDAHTPATITSHAPGKISPDIEEVIVGLQTHAPLKRAIMPNGGIRMVVSGLEAFGYKADP